MKYWRCVEKSTVRENEIFLLFAIVNLEIHFFLNSKIRWSHPRAQCSLWLTGGPGAYCESLFLPLALSSSSPSRAFPRFLHRRRLARRASRPYCGSARRASCRRSVHSPRGPVRCRHCSRIRLRTPAIERRAALVDFAHRTPISSYKMTAVLLSSSSHLASSLFSFLLLHFCLQELATRL